MRIVPYSAEFRTVWDAYVTQSRNSTFLFYRDYMDYHRERFEDASVLCFSPKDKLLALFPATAHRQEQYISSHSGLTYGGLILGEGTHTIDVLSIYESLLAYYREQGFSTLYVKPIPHIYHRSPAEEELYALFRHHAKLSSRGVSSSLLLESPIALSTLRKRKVKQAQSAEIKFVESIDLKSFWELLSSVLQQRHHVQPIHTLNEITQLHNAFPNEIKLYVAQTKEGEILAGTLLYLSCNVAHAQYIAASENGRKQGALDALFAWLIQQRPFAVGSSRPLTYFDFGISTEQGGRQLNEGLIFQKEGFGARAVLYDEYELSLT